MKTKIFILSLFIACAQQVSAQATKAGVNTLTPNSTFAIGGSVSAAYTEVSASATLTDLNYYVTFTGTIGGTLTLPAIGTGATQITGRIYRIKNISTQTVTLQASVTNTIRSSNATPSASFALAPNSYVEVVCSSGVNWDLSFIGTPSVTNVELYGAQLAIPPHKTHTADFSNHSVTTYDTGTGTDKWFVISKTSTSGSMNSTTVNAARMTIVYEYQGTAFNTTNLYPLLNTGNNSSWPDVYTVSFIGLATVSGKTRLTVSVARAETFGSAADWAGQFLLNLLLARKTS